MKRRTFLKRVGQVIAGTIASLIEFKDFPIKTKQDFFTDNGMDENCEWLIFKKNQTYEFLQTGKTGQYLGCDLKWHNPEEMSQH